MNASDIIRELPKLSADERAAVRRRLRELEEQDELLILHESAATLFREIDNREGNKRTQDRE
ncbi:MAG TPA: hypothetical protein VNV43_14430 [Candidatus Acidoferrales bacterium]|nr:hypothetical protein [Candidatus Acidoferrales bacterium]